LGRIWLHRHVLEGKTDGKKKVTVRRGRKCRQVPDDRTENGRYCKLKEKY
jgi:hypothetical protein